MHYNFKLNILFFFTSLIIYVFTTDFVFCCYCCVPWFKFSHCLAHHWLAFEWRIHLLAFQMDKIPFTPHTHTYFVQMTHSNAFYEQHELCNHSILNRLFYVTQHGIYTLCKQAMIFFAILQNTSCWMRKTKKKKKEWTILHLKYSMWTINCFVTEIDTFTTRVPMSNDSQTGYCKWRINAGYACDHLHLLFSLIRWQFFFLSLSLYFV